MIFLNYNAVRPISANSSCEHWRKSAIKPIFDERFAEVAKGNTFQKTSHAMDIPFRHDAMGCLVAANGRQRRRCRRCLVAAIATAATTCPCANGWRCGRRCQRCAIATAACVAAATSPCANGWR